MRGCKIKTLKYFTYRLYRHTQTLIIIHTHSNIETLGSKGKWISGQRGKGAVFRAGASTVYTGRRDLSHINRVVVLFLAPIKMAFYYYQGCNELKC